MSCDNFNLIVTKLPNKLLASRTAATVMEESVEPQGLPDAAQVLILLMCTRHYAKDSKNRSHSVLQKVLDGSRGEGAPRPRVDVQSLNTRGYLDHTVVPILLDAMAAVAKERWACVTTPVEMHVFVYALYIS